MRVVPRIAALAIVLALVESRPSAAQIDYRNLDAHRPVRTEDAYPIERYAFELAIPYDYENGLAGEQAHVVAPELAYGAFANAAIGLELPFAALRAPGGTDWGLAGPRLFALYNFNTEGPSLPALSLRGDVALPVGDLAGDDPQLTLTGIATRSWGLTRLHLNASATAGHAAGRPPVDPPPRWAVSLAADRSFYRRSLLLLAELGVLRAAPGAPTEVTVAAGARYQLAPTLVFDAGFSRRLVADAGPDLGLTVGLSHAFGIAGWMPGVSR